MIRRICFFLGVPLFIAVWPLSLSASRMKSVNANEKADFCLQYHFSQGCKWYQSKKWAKAAHEFERIVSLFPDDALAAQASFYLGVSYFEMEELDFANTAFSDYLKSSPDPELFEEAILYKFAIAEQLAEGYKRRYLKAKYIPKCFGGRELALSIYDEIILVVPMHSLAVRSLYAKGTLLQTLEEFRASIETYQTLIRCFPRDELTPAAYLKIAEDYNAQAQLESQNPDLIPLAELNLRKFEEEFPRDELVRYAEKLLLGMREIYAKELSEIGDFYERKGNHAAAAIYYASAIDQFPQTQVAIYCRAQLALLDMGQNAAVEETAAAASVAEVEQELKVSDEQDKEEYVPAPEVEQEQSSNEQELHSYPVESIELSADENQTAFSPFEEPVQLYSYPVESIELSSYENQTATSSFEEPVQLYSYPVESIELSSYENQIATSSFEEPVQVVEKWEIEEETPVSSEITYGQDEVMTPFADASVFTSEEEAGRYMESRFEKGRHYYQKGNWRQAVEEFQALLSLMTAFPLLTDLHYYLGVCYFELQEPSLARTHFLEYLALSDCPAWQEKVLRYEWLIARSMASAWKGRLFDMGDACRLMGQDAALVVYQEIIDYSPMSEEGMKSLYAKGELLCQMERYRESMECYHSFISRFYGQEMAPLAYLKLAEVYCRLSLKEEDDPAILAWAEKNAADYQHAFGQDEGSRIIDWYMQTMREKKAQQICKSGYAFEQLEDPHMASNYYWLALNHFSDTWAVPYCLSRLHALGMLEESMTYPIETPDSLPPPVLMAEDADGIETITDWLPASGPAVPQNYDFVHYSLLKKQPQK